MNVSTEHFPKVGATRTPTDNVGLDQLLDHANTALQVRKERDATSSFDSFSPSRADKTPQDQLFVEFLKNNQEFKNLGELKDSRENQKSGRFKKMMNVIPKYAARGFASGLAALTVGGLFPAIVVSGFFAATTMAALIPGVALVSIPAGLAATPLLGLLGQTVSAAVAAAPQVLPGAVGLGAIVGMTKAAIQHSRDLKSFDENVKEADNLARTLLKQDSSSNKLRSH